MKTLLLALMFLCPLAFTSMGQTPPEDWQRTAFERFKEKAINLSGKRSTRGAKGFTYMEGPLKNKTAGEGVEWCIETWSNMSLKAKKVYYQPTVTGQKKSTSNGASVTLKVGESFNINGTRGTVGKIEVIDAETLRVTLNMTSNTGSSIQNYDVKIK